MKKFVYKVLLLVIPFFVYFILAERYLLTGTEFAIKKNYIENNKSTVEVLVLGSSISQDAVNPQYLKNKAANLSNGGQPLTINYYLLEKYIQQMPVLKTVFLEVSPHNFYSDLPDDNWNTYIYSRFYNIPYKTEHFSFKKYTVLFSNFKFFNNIFFSYWNPFAYQYKVNEYGSIVNDYNDRFEELNYDEEKIKNTFEMNTSFYTSNLFQLNENTIKRIIGLCNDHQVRLILFSPPVFSTYRDHIPPSKMEQVNNSLDQLTKEFHISYHDYAADKRFVVTDFKNDNHLNSTGAEKFSKMLNEHLHP